MARQNRQTWQSAGRSGAAYPNCENNYFLFASARLNGDYSFVRSDWNEGIESWRFGVQTWGDSGEFKDSQHS